MTLLNRFRLTRKTSYSPGIAHFMVLGAPQEHGLFEMYWAKGRSRTIDVKLSAASPNSVKVARKVSPGATGTAPHIEPDRTCWQTKSALRTRRRPGEGLSQVGFFNAIVVRVGAGVAGMKGILSGGQAGEPGRLSH